MEKGFSAKGYLGQDPWATNLTHVFSWSFTGFVVVVDLAGMARFSVVTQPSSQATPPRLRERSPLLLCGVRPFVGHDAY